MDSCGDGSEQLILPLLEATVIVVDVVLSDKSSDLFLQLRTMTYGWPGAQTAYGVPLTLQWVRNANVL